MVVILAFNYVDRLTLGIVLEPIKRDLQLTDTQLGLLTGIAFAIFYAAMGIPIARWADRGNRVSIIALTCGLWSAAVMVSAAVTSFLQLMLVRVFVGVGEAGCQPAALSLISDYYSRAERTRAIARYKLGWPIALIAGNLAAGWLNQFLGWRWTFFLIGLPNLAIAVVAFWVLKEPRLGAQGIARPMIASAPAEPLPRVFAVLWRNRTYRHLALCFLFSSFFTDGILQWQPAFFIRSHGMATGELGTWLAIFYGGGTLLGTFLGGELTARYAATNERLQLIIVAVLYALFAVLTAAVYLAPNYPLAFVLLGLAVLGGGATNGPLYAASQTLVSPRMRAMSIAIILFGSNLIGMGFGPLLVGWLSDVFAPYAGNESLRYAIVAMTPGYFWCTWHLWKASRTVTEDVDAAMREEAACAASASLAGEPRVSPGQFPAGPTHAAKP
nr:MFS transporter [Sphingomonas sp. Y57]